MPKFLLLPALFVLVFSACDRPTAGEGEAEAPPARRTLPASNGGILDLMVIADEALWAQGPGENFRAYFTEMLYGLPQPEPRFTVRQVAPADFNDLLQRSRYLVLFSLGDTLQFQQEYERWAQEQWVFFLSAPTAAELSALVRQKREAIAAQIREAEDRRMQKRRRKLLHSELPAALSDRGLYLGIPKDYELSVEKEDFVLYWKRTNRADLGIMVHIRPLPDDQSIIGQEIVPLRDSLTRLYVPGAREGSYMVTEDLIKPDQRATELAGSFAMESRGLWRTEGDLMGGPFVSYTVYDEKGQQAIYLDAFVLAPNQKKRNRLFELESILRSLRIKDGAQ